MNETLKRSLSGVVYIVLLLSSILYSTESFFILFGIFLLIATFEFCSLVKINKIAPIIIASVFYILFLPLNSVVHDYLLPLKENNYHDLIVLAITIMVSIKSIYFLFNKRAIHIDAFSKYLYLFGYIIFPFIILAKIPFGVKGYNPKIIISIFILIWTNDTFAYIVGKSIGRNKLFERISPKKTIEGFVGGLLFSILASYFIAYYYIEINPSNIYIWVVIACIAGIFGTVGDLVESKFKRIARVKDSGKIMPGHGGVLDRLDSVIFVAPIVFLFYQILNYVS